ncbi:MAG: ParB N-terminal domain-containing protein [Methylobacterium mesophilicum]|nr:ParB N-terminal domain-containing protein [Methylobacterium mesophilicum]
MIDETDQPSGVVVGFERATVVVPLGGLVATRSFRPGVKQSKKYAQILASARLIGLVEPPVVRPDAQEPSRFYLLDGHLRVEALKDLGQTEVECLISTDDEAYTYNKRINRLSAVQEHKMIVRAVELGVSEELIAEALDLKVEAIQRKFRLLDNICPQAVELLKATECPAKVFEVLRRMSNARQVEAAQLMIGQNNFSVMFAKALLMATPEIHLVDPRKKRPGGEAAINAEQIAKMGSELANLQMQVRAVEDTYGLDNLHLTVAKGYVAKLLSNPRVVRWINTHRQEYLSEFQQVAEIETLAALPIAAE